MIHETRELWVLDPSADVPERLSECAPRVAMLQLELPITRERFEADDAVTLVRGALVRRGWLTHQAERLLDVLTEAMPDPDAKHALDFWFQSWWSALSGTLVPIEL